MSDADSSAQASETARNAQKQTGTLTAQSSHHIGGRGDRSQSGRTMLHTKLPKAKKHPLLRCTVVPPSAVNCIVCPIPSLFRRTARSYDASSSHCSFGALAD